MNIRQMKPEDFEKIVQMMKEEGCTEPLDFMNKDNTYVMEDVGFFNYKFEHGFPSLRHFCIRKDKRNSNNARQLFRFYRDLMKDFKWSIINADKEYVCKIIEKYFKVKPYAQKDNTYFYLVEV